MLQKKHFRLSFKPEKHGDRSNGFTCRCFLFYFYFILKLYKSEKNLKQIAYIAPLTALKECCH